jgi:hypothetical protein
MSESVTGSNDGSVIVSDDPTSDGCVVAPPTFTG